MIEPQALFRTSLDTASAAVIALFDAMYSTETPRQRLERICAIFGKAPPPNLTDDLEWNGEDCDSNAVEDSVCEGRCSICREDDR